MLKKYLVEYAKTNNSLRCYAIHAQNEAIVINNIFKYADNIEKVLIQEERFEK